jgi:PTS system N-acetylglucosamine-specific IIB component
MVVLTGTVQWHERECPSSAVLSTAALVPAPALHQTQEDLDPKGPLMSSKAQQILDALGGADNIVEIEPCITRLRTEVTDASLVDEAALKAAGAHGVIKAGSVVQVVVGPEADNLAEDIEDLM